MRIERRKYPTNDTWCGINIWSPFWPWLILGLGVMQFIATIVMVVAATIAGAL